MNIQRTTEHFLIVSLFFLLFQTAGCIAEEYEAEYVPGELIVGFLVQPELSAKAAEEIYTTAHAQAGAEPIKTLSSLGHTNIQLVQVSTGTSVEQALKAYQGMADVAYAEPNYIFHALKTPNDPAYDQLWGMNLIMAPAAWDYTTGSKEVIVAVIDSGVDYRHEDLLANMWTNPGEIPDNKIDDDGNGFIDDYYGWNFVSNTENPMDDYGHGTHCTGTLGAIGDNAVGIVGINWDVSIMAVKGLDNKGSGTMFDLIASIIYASNMGADVINNSWGGESTRSEALEEAIRQSSALFVFASGNSNQDLDITPSSTTINLPNVILVAAADENGIPVAFTNYGKTTVHVAAPGEAIYSTTPKNSYGHDKGTSMAAAQVSGLAGLMKAANPELSAAETKSIIMSTVTPSSAWKDITVTGGIINAQDAVSSAYKRDFQASFTIDVTEGYAPLTIQLTDTSSGNPTSWTWDFGDDTPISHDRTATHTYQDADVWTIRLHVSDGTKNSTATQTVIVKPKASVTGTPRFGPAPLDVIFTLSSTGGSGSGYLKAGDGKIHEIKTITGEPLELEHTYTKDGVYSVGFYFEKESGLSDYSVQTDYITVGSTPPPPTLTPTPTVTPHPGDTNINLMSGWNMVSVPGWLKEGKNTAMIFAHVPSSGHSLLAFDPVKDTWITVKATDLIQPLNGYWIYAEHPCIVPLELDTNPIMVPPSRELGAGWNIIGTAGLYGVSARDALLSVQNQWAYLTGFDAQTQQYMTSIINGGSGEHSDSARMQPYMGYWIYMRSPGKIAGFY